jgi:hypothetical protein
MRHGLSMIPAGVSLGALDYAIAARNEFADGRQVGATRPRPRSPRPSGTLSDSGEPVCA